MDEEEKRVYDNIVRIQSIKDYNNNNTNNKNCKSHKNSMERGQNCNCAMTSLFC